MGPLTRAVRPCFDEADLRQDAPLTYDILHALRDAGKIRLEDVRVAGVREDLEAPRTRILPAE